MTEENKSPSNAENQQRLGGSSGSDNLTPGHHNPTALEVIQNLIDPEEDKQASAHMKGHISKSIIDDTFLFEA